MVHFTYWRQGLEGHWGSILWCGVYCGFGIMPFIHIGNLQFGLPSETIVPSSPMLKSRLLPVSQKGWFTDILEILRSLRLSIMTLEKERVQSHAMYSYNLQYLFWLTSFEFMAGNYGYFLIWGSTFWVILYSYWENILQGLTSLFLPRNYKDVFQS